MIAVERSPWNLTKEFLIGNGATVDKIIPEGIAIFDCLTCTKENDDRITLTRAIESNPPASFSLEFKREAAEEGTVVSVTCKLVTSPEQLRELLIGDAYCAYDKDDGTLHLAGVKKVRLLHPTLAIYPLNRAGKSLNLTTGGVRPLANGIFIRPTARDVVI